MGKSRSVSLSVTLVLLSTILLAACAPSTATPQATRSFTFTGRGFGAAPTETPVPTQTPVPSPTTVATPTPTPPPAAPASLSGKLAYISGGIIWSQDLSSGTKLQLTPKSDYFSDPQWSPSGKYVAFLNGTELWMVGSDGKGYNAIVRGVSVLSFAWSPKSDELAYETGDHHLYLVQIGQGTAQPQPIPLITATNGPVSGVIVNSQPFWSPDGQQIAVSVSQPLSGSSAEYAGLWTVQAQSGTTPVEAYSAGNPPPFGVILAGWTPDGQSLLYWPVPEFSATMAADGEPLEVAPISNNNGALTQLGVTLNLPGMWSGTTNGDYLAAAVGSGKGTWTDKQIHVYDASNNSRWTVSAQGQAALYPSFSPDGQYIVYVGGADLGSITGISNPLQTERHLWLVNLKGTQNRQLTTDANYSDGPVSWTPQNAIVFPRMSYNGTVSIWSLWPWLPGSQPTELVKNLSLPAGTANAYSYPDWSRVFSYWAGSAG